MGITRKISSARPAAQSHTQHKFAPKIERGLTPIGFKVAPARPEKVPLYDVRGQMSFNTTGKQALGAMLLLGTLGSVIRTASAAPQFTRVMPSVVRYQGQYISCEDDGFFVASQNTNTSCLRNNTGSYISTNYEDWANYPNITVANVSDIWPECDAVAKACAAPYTPFVKNSPNTILYNNRVQINCNDSVLFKTQRGAAGTRLEQLAFYCLKDSGAEERTVDNTDEITELPVPSGTSFYLQFGAEDLCGPVIEKCNEAIAPASTSTPTPTPTASGKTDAPDNIKNIYIPAAAAVGGLVVGTIGGLAAKSACNSKKKQSAPITDVELARLPSLEILEFEAEPVVLVTSSTPQGAQPQSSFRPVPIAPPRTVSSVATPLPERAAPVPPPRVVPAVVPAAAPVATPDVVLQTAPPVGPKPQAVARPAVGPKPQTTQPTAPKPTVGPKPPKPAPRHSPIGE